MMGAALVTMADSARSISEKCVVNPLGQLGEDVFQPCHGFNGLDLGTVDQKVEVASVSTSSFVADE